MELKEKQKKGMQDVENDYAAWFEIWIGFRYQIDFILVVGLFDFLLHLDYCSVSIQHIHTQQNAHIHVCCGMR
jgi:hypothetical protein